MTTTKDAFDEELELALIELQLQQGRLVDKYDHALSESIFKNWTPKAIRALGVHRIPQTSSATKRQEKKDSK
jgi:hypothetical protein